MDRFQLSFGWKNLITFLFFSLLSFTVLFLLGFLVGKNSVSVTQEVILNEPPVVEQNKTESEKPTKTEEQAKPEEQTKTEKPTKIEKPTPPPKTQTTISKETPALFGKNDYVIQLIAYDKISSAEKLQKLLKDNFYPAYILVFERGDKTFYRVRVGSYSLEEAKRVQKDLEKQFPQYKKTQIFKIR